jgi:predicted RNA-binding Zn ribbon-like protein
VARPLPDLALAGSDLAHPPLRLSRVGNREACEESHGRLLSQPRPRPGHLSGFEARLLLAIERLQCEEAWPRLKACTDDACQWAFYDATRNRSRTWCSMDVCGNREKTKRYRQRKASS